MLFHKGLLNRAGVIGASSYVLLAFEVVLSMLVIPIAIDRAGVEAYGVILIAQAVVSIFLVLESGVGAVTAQRVAAHYGEGNITQAKRVADCGVLITLSMAFLIACGLSVALVVSDYVINVGGEVVFAPLSFLSLLLLVWSIPFGMVTSVIDGIANATGRPVAIKIGAAFANGFAFLVATLLIDGQYFLPGYLAIKSAMYLSLSLVIFSKLIDCSVQRLLDCVTEMKSLLRIAKKLFPSRLANNSFSSTEPILIAAIASPEYLVIYNTTRKAADLVKTLLDRLPGILLTPLSELLTTVGKIEFWRNIRLIYLVFLLLSAAGFLFFVFLNELFISLWVGAELYGGNQLTFLFATIFFLFVHNNALSFILTAVEAYEAGARLILFESVMKCVALLNGFIFDSILIGMLGILFVSVVFSVVYIVTWINWIRGGSYGAAGKA